jgi:hypothetical protein
VAPQPGEIRLSGYYRISAAVILGGQMTSDQQRQFETQWPALAIRLQRLLARKKVSPWLIEDLVQETGLRLIKMWSRVDQTRPVWPLTATIGLNLLRDELRRGTSNELTQLVPEEASEESVEERGLARLELRAVGGALSQMPERQRRAILADISGEADGAPVATGVRMMRMRARRKLQHLVDHASMLGVTVGLQLRRVAREAQLFIGRAIPTDADRATAAVVGLFAALSFGVAVVPSAPSEAGEIDNVRAPLQGSAVLAGAAGASAGAEQVHARETRSLTESQGERNKGIGAARSPKEPSGDAPNGGLPRGTKYRLSLGEGTFVQGEVEADVTGLPSAARDAAGRPEGIGSANCSLSLTHTTASCSHGGEGWENRGFRARHRGEAWVAGERVI